jgi:hypothetical protein
MFKHGHPKYNKINLQRWRTTLWFPNVSEWETLETLEADRLIEAEAKSIRAAIDSENGW